MKEILINKDSLAKELAEDALNNILKDNNKSLLPEDIEKLKYTFEEENIVYKPEIEDFYNKSYDKYLDIIEKNIVK